MSDYFMTEPLTVDEFHRAMNEVGQALAELAEQDAAWHAATALASIATGGDPKPNIDAMKAGVDLAKAYRAGAVRFDAPGDA